MDFFYDGQIRRYVTQFMRGFSGFKYQAGDYTKFYNKLKKQNIIQKTNILKETIFKVESAYVHVQRPSFNLLSYQIDINVVQL